MDPCLVGCSSLCQWAHDLLCGLDKAQHQLHVEIKSFYLFDMSQPISFSVFWLQSHEGLKCLMVIFSDFVFSLHQTHESGLECLFLFWIEGKLIHSMVAHLDSVTSLAVDPNGLYLMSGSKCSLCLLSHAKIRKYNILTIFPNDTRVWNRSKCWQNVAWIPSAVSIRGNQNYTDSVQQEKS